MSIDDFLTMAEKILLPRRLSAIDEIILRFSLLGLEYSEMAQKYTYSIPYLKQNASQLWHDLSEVLGMKVTKKNLQFVLQQYQYNIEQEEFVKQIKLGDKTANHLKSYIKFPGGAIPLDSPFYINRSPIEELSYAEICQTRCLLRIKAPKQMGKTSLLNRIVAYGKAMDYKTVCLDFQEADKTVFSSLDKFLQWFCVNITSKLNIKPMLDDYWDDCMGSKTSCKIYFEDYLLKQINSPIVLGLNEVNRVFEYPDIAEDFLAMLRFWHELGSQFEIWQKLRMVLIYSTEIYIPLNINQSPFNVGLPIVLPNLTSKQVQNLAQAYGLDWSDASKTEQLMAMVGGHPYLVNLALYHLCCKEINLTELLQTAPTLTGIYGNHLRSLLVTLQDEPSLASAMRQIVTKNESVPLEAITAYKLESMGLVQMNENLATASCQLYRLYFSYQLTVKNNCVLSFE
jgi:hypothetical protein